MKINNINNISFTYNKSYHDKVEKYLSSRKKYKNMAQALLKADKELLSMEDEIIKMEHTKEGVQSQQYYDLAGCYVDLKQALAFHIASNFPTLKYPENIYDNYNSEIASLKQPLQAVWRSKLCNEISVYMENKPNAQSKRQQDDKSVDNKIEDKKIIEKTLEQVREQAVDDYQNSMVNDLLSKYTPTHLSPQGFEDVVGMDDVKQRLNEEIIDYAKNPLLAELDEYEYGISAPRGFLFYGPPGCGKTYIVQALASESGLPLYKMDVSKIGSKWVNQTSKNIQKAFDFLEKEVQRNQKPCILFMDEIDSLGINRGSDSGGSGENLKVTATLLKLIESARDKGIIPIASTNRYDLLDDALKERFDSQIYIGLPDIKQIKSLLQTSLSKRKKGALLAFDDEAMDEIAKMMKGYSNRSIVFMIDKAAKNAKRKLRHDITKQDLIDVINSQELKKTNEANYKRLSDEKRRMGFNIE